MAHKTVVTREFYDNLVNAFRNEPGNASHAARKAGCDRRMAQRGFDRGWSPAIAWARPIRQVLEEDKEAARSAQRKLEEEHHRMASNEREKARADSVAALAQEGQMIKAGRVTTLNALVTVAGLLPAIKSLADALTADVAAGVTISPGMKMRVIKDFSSVVRQLVSASNELVVAERASKGEPSKIIGIDINSATMTVDEAVREIKEVTELYALAKERGLVDDPAAPGGDEPDTTH